MKKLTLASTVLAASMCVGTQSVMAAGSLDDQDMLFAFGAESSTQTVVLSKQEMNETEGEWFLNSAGALAGGLGAGFGAYWGGSSLSTSFGVGFAGAAAGAWSPVRGFTSAWQTFGGGFSGGYASSWF